MISIVIPVYNQAEYLSDCLDSIVNQTEKDFDVVIVNDGSTDNSGEIADKYAKEYGWTIIHQINKGLSSARNSGIMNARGLFVLFIDSDDILLENAIEEITKTIKTEATDIVAPSLKCFGLSDQEVILIKEPKLEDFRIGNRVGSCICIRKTALFAVGGYQPKMMQGYEDLALVCDLLARGYKLVTIPKILWLYRVKEQSMALTAKDHHQELIDQINHDVPSAKLSF